MTMQSGVVMATGTGAPDSEDSNVQRQEYDISDNQFSDERPTDMLERLKGGSRFSTRYGVVMTGLMWFLAGAQISLSFFVALEPPRFPDCSALSLHSHTTHTMTQAAVLATQANRFLMGELPASPSSLQSVYPRLLEDQAVPLLPPPETSSSVKCDAQVPLLPTDCDTPHVYMRPGISIISSFDIPPSYCEPEPWKNASWVHSALFAGILIGALGLGRLSDVIGRRPTITLSVLCLTVVGLWSAVVQSVWQYGLARLGVGVFTTGAALPSMVLLSEVTPSDRRHWTVLVQALAFCMAAVYVALLAVVVPSWRLLTTLVTLPTLIFLGGFTCCTGTYIESPRWLVAKGHMDQAFAVWLRIAKICKVELPEGFDLTAFIKNELCLAHGEEGKIRDSLVDLEEELSYLSLQRLVSPDNLSRTMKRFPTSLWMWTCIWLWSSCAFIYYGVLFDFKELLPHFDSASVSTSHEPVPTNHTVLRNLMASVSLMANLDDAPSLHLLRYLQFAPDPLENSVMPPRGVLPNNAPPEETLKDFEELDVGGIGLINQTVSSRNKSTLGEVSPIESSMSEPSHSELSQTAETSNGTKEARPLPSADPYKSFDIASVIDFLDKNKTHYYKEALHNMTKSLQNETLHLIESAKNIPQEAQRAAEEYHLGPKVYGLVDDIKSQFKPEDAMAQYWRDVRIQSVLVVSSFAAEVPAYIVAMWMASSPSIGRRSTCFFSLLVGSSLLIVSSMTHALSDESDAREVQVFRVVSLLLGRCCVAAVFMLLYLYCAEVFPTSVRTSVLGLLSASARIGCIFAAPLAQYLDSSIPDGASLFFGLVGFSAAMITPMCLPETCGKPLYDTLDSLEEAYTASGYVETFFSHPGVRICGVLGKCTCCLNRMVHRCLGFPGTARTTTLEERGHRWLKEQWKKTSRNTSAWKDQTEKMMISATDVVRGAGPKGSNFIPLQDMAEETPPHPSTVLDLTLEDDIELHDELKLN
eukprot:Blabericola_migrator_1__755@NODE_1188_length_5170_cov_116_229277_g554_i1_p1_GENE_NODE_1188_length_5170_cov_116_229277_g554_i1NODE_1188_length_5170_cov_116_229277_g554_i1_p1_ORF_typecomplete_len981_score111_12Sugar_tr/PF00083_24/1_5e32Sugar_tr/PF00083_24/1_7e19MFS_1/PF07690_16/4_3e03MFS_1/PF07690_16/1e15MFS_1/PF07690_16/1_4e07TRI12/PF06609_13/4_2e11TRI12/PF06609_13/1_5e02MFS_3/PF05977_13/0_0023MFS_3/PF05977_13/0_18MFS_4/PF06779_14/0_00065MFS_4/PF06779_14/1_2MFS_Mycoplasma/PF07672_13/1_3e02MFS_Myc